MLEFLFDVFVTSLVVLPLALGYPVLALGVNLAVGFVVGCLAAKEHWTSGRCARFAFLSALLLLPMLWLRPVRSWVGRG